MDGLACLDEIVKRFPEIKVVMLSASTSPELIAAALRRGASAYLAKSVDPNDLPSTLRQVMEGNVWRGTASTDDDESRGGRPSVSPSAKPPSCRRWRGGSRTTRSRRSCG